MFDGELAMFELAFAICDEAPFSLFLKYITK